MTRNTNRNNVKPMLFCIAFVVMVLLRLVVATVAFFGIGSWESFVPNLIINCIFCLATFWETSLVPVSTVFCANSSFSCFGVKLPAILTFVSFFVSLKISKPSFTFVVGFLACFTHRLESIRTGTVFVKFKNRLNLLACGTSFGYDLLRHSFFLIKKLCLEPVSGYSPASGLFHYRGATL